MGEYFASIGNTPPPDTNIFVLDLVNTDFTPEEGVHTLPDMHMHMSHVERW